MPIKTLISAVMRWTERTFATPSDVDAMAHTVVKANAPDWDAGKGESGHIKNRPFYMEDVPLIPSATYEFAEDDPSVTLDTEVGPKAGTEYTVIWDGKEYTVTGVYTGSYSYMPYIGNGTIYRDIFTDGDNSAPFCYIETGMGMQLYAKTPGTHTFELVSQVPVPIDPKFLPPTVGAPGTATNAEVFNGLDGERASGEGSHAEGNGTATAAYAHAEGGSISTRGGTASGRGSHAEGQMTTAAGYASHAEGENTTATGNYSHAEGTNTDAVGNGSHAEGVYTEAYDTGAHSEGGYTIARGYAQHVQGKFNVEDTAGTYAHIVGNGKSTTARSNAHTLDWDGNAWYAGTVLVGGTSQADAAEVATKAYVDEVLGVIENGTY